jgi:hypothetical protein
VTRAELVQEVVDRGYDYVSTARIGKFIDRAYKAICSRYPWPFLETTTTGTGEVAIADLGKILSVNANEERLRGVDRRWLAGTVSDLGETGTAQFWYLENSALKTYPVDAATITVRYVKRPANLSDGDEPLIPEEWQSLIVARACIDCLRDDDEYEVARALRLEVEEELREMVNALLKPNYANSELVERTGAPGDYL